MSTQRTKPQQLNRPLTCFCYCCLQQHEQLYSADKLQSLRTPNHPVFSALSGYWTQERNSHVWTGSRLLESKQRNMEDKQRRLKHIFTLNLELMVKLISILILILSKQNTIVCTEPQRIYIHTHIHTDIYMYTYIWKSTFLLPSGMEKRKDEEASYPPKLLAAKRLHVHNQHLQWML